MDGLVVGSRKKEKRCGHKAKKEIEKMPQRNRVDLAIGTNDHVSGGARRVVTYLCFWVRLSYFGMCRVPGRPHYPQRPRKARAVGIKTQK